MSCFSLAWLGNLLIWMVVIIAFALIIRVLITMAAGLLGGWGGVVAQILNIIIGAVILIALIILVFDLLTCALGVPRLRP